VTVGMSLSSLPSAPGAPLGQSGRGSFISARDKRQKEERMATAKKVFMDFPVAKPTRIADRFNAEFRPWYLRMHGSACRVAARPNFTGARGQGLAAEGSQRATAV